MQQWFEEGELEVSLKKEELSVLEKGNTLCSDEASFQLQRGKIPDGSLFALRERAYKGVVLPMVHLSRTAYRLLRESHFASESLPEGNGDVRKVIIYVS